MDFLNNPFWGQKIFDPIPLDVNNFEILLVRQSFDERIYEP